MRLVHADHQVIEAGQYGGKGHAQRFLELMEIKLGVRLAVEYFPDVEDEQLDLGRFFKRQRGLLIVHRVGIVIFAIINLREAHFRFQPLEDILGVSGVGLLAQLVIDGAAGCQDEEVSVALRLVQVIDARAHQAGLADAGGHGKAEGREVKLGVYFDGALLFAVFGSGSLYGGRAVPLIIAVGADGVQIGQRFFLRTAQAHGIADSAHNVRHLSHLTFKAAFCQ